MSDSTIQSAFGKERNGESYEFWSAECPDEAELETEKRSDERATPAWFIEKLHDAIRGLFDLDPCSGAESEPIAETRFTKEDNGLLKPWNGYGTLFINPPYSELPKWFKKIFREMGRSDSDSPDLALCLLPSYSSSSKAFQKYGTEASYLCLIKGRLTFGGQQRQAPFSSLLLVYGDLDESSELAQTLDEMGTLYSRAEIKHAQDNAQLGDLLTDGGGTVASSPASSGEPHQSLQIMDVSDRAPAVPQGTVELHQLAIGDELYIDFDSSTYGYPHDAPEESNVEILAGNSEHSPYEPPRGWDSITCYDNKSDTWIVISQNPDRLSEMRYSISTDGGRDWADVSVMKLYRLSANSTPAIDPYGEGTSYVC